MMYTLKSDYVTLSGLKSNAFSQLKQHCVYPDVKTQVCHTELIKCTLCIKYKWQVEWRTDICVGTAEGAVCVIDWVTVAESAAHVVLYTTVPAVLTYFIIYLILPAYEHIRTLVYLHWFIWQMLALLLAFSYLLYCPQCNCSNQSDTWFAILPANTKLPSSSRTHTHTHIAVNPFWE